MDGGTKLELYNLIKSLIMVIKKGTTFEIISCALDTVAMWKAPILASIRFQASKYIVLTYMYCVFFYFIVLYLLSSYYHKDYHYK